MTKEEKDCQATPDTSGIDVPGGGPAAAEAAGIPAAETAVAGPAGEPESDDPPVRRPTGFWTRRRIGLAGGLAAALVAGAVGIGLAMAPDAGTAPATEAPGAEQKADAEQKTPAAATGAGAEGARAADPAAEEAPDAAAAPAEDDAAQADPAAGEAAQGAPAAQAAPEAGEPRASQSPKSGSGSGSGKAAPAPEKKPAHEHSWQPVTEKRWVENWVTVTDQAAWDEPVYERVVVCACGAVFSSSAAAGEHAMAQESGQHNSHSEDRQVDTIHHEAQTHQEDQGYYETVTVGQKCSCGATK